MNGFQQQIVSLLQSLVQQQQQRLTGVEIGVAQGQTSEILLRQFPSLRLIMVDVWESGESSPAYRRSGDRCARLSITEHYENRVRTERRTAFAGERRSVWQIASQQAARRWREASFDFVIIDADHTYEAVSADLAAWAPKIRAGGLVLGHDYNHPREKRGLWGVKRAVDEFCANLKLELQLGPESSWWFWQPTKLAKARLPVTVSPCGQSSNQ